MKFKKVETNHWTVKFNNITYHIERMSFKETDIYTKDRGSINVICQIRHRENEKFSLTRLKKQVNDFLNYGSYEGLEY